MGEGLGCESGAHVRVPQVDQALEVVLDHDPVLRVDDLEQWPSALRPGPCLYPAVCTKVGTQPVGRPLRLLRGEAAASGDGPLPIRGDDWLRDRKSTRLN